MKDKKERLFNVKQHSKQIFKVSPFVKWQNNTWA